MSKCDDLLGTVVANDPHILSNVVSACKTQPSICVGGRLYVNTVTEQSMWPTYMNFCLYAPLLKKTWILQLCT